MPDEDCGVRRLAVDPEGMSVRKWHADFRQQMKTRVLEKESRGWRGVCVL